METSNSKKVIVQTLLRRVGDDYSMAEKYYSLLSTVNDLKLTTREIQLIAFAAVNGNISYSSIREEFCKKFNSTSPTINNMISKLKKVKVLVKDGTKVKVNPLILLNFKDNIKLEIKIEHHER
jgi:hypothetical protein